MYMGKRFFSTNEAAKLLGISRIAVFKKIKSGEIKAKKIGRNFMIEQNNLSYALGSVLNEKQKRKIEKAVEKTVREYGEALQLLGRE